MIATYRSSPWLRLVLAAIASAAPAAAAHVWEKRELTLTAAREFANPYTDATVWVDLTGPNFHKRVYGFWDGGRTFRVRIAATAPGTWRWRSGSAPADTGLAGKSGSFVAVAWTEAELRENPLRHGFLRATANQHALQHADGAPFFALGDTWWATGTNRFRTQWFDPRNGTWRDAGNAPLRASAIGVVSLPNFPGDNDWGVRLVHEDAPTGGR